MHIEQLMTKNVGTCSVDDTLNVAAQIMWERDCGSVPVLDADGRVVGMLTDRDICMAALLRGQPLATIGAGSVMSKELHACSPHDPVDLAGRQLQTHQIRRVPVVDPEGRLVGILSLGDLARAVAENSRSANDFGAPAVEETLAAISRPRK